MEENLIHRDLKQQANKIARYNLDIATKGKRETGSLLRAAQNNTMRTNYIKVKTDNPQEN